MRILGHISLSNWATTRLWFAHAHRRHACPKWNHAAIVLGITHPLLMSHQCSYKRVAPSTTRGMPHLRSSVSTSA